MNKQTKIIIGASAVVVCVAVAAVIRELGSAPADEEPVAVASVKKVVPPTTPKAVASVTNVEPKAVAKAARAATTNAVKKVVRRPVVVETPWTPAEQKTVDALQHALDNDDMKGVVAQLKTAAASTNAAMRLKAVESLQWFGEKAVPELTPFMADADDEVRTTAIDAWTAGVSQMEAGPDKADAVLMGMSIVMDRDQLGLMVMQVDDLPEAERIDVLIRVIEGPNEVSAEVAREHYKFWMEEDYTGK